MAARYLVAGGNGQWNSTSNWSATSGGAAGASFPVAADTVIFDAASANASITVDVASACTSITASNYTGTLTVNATLACSTGFTFSTGMTCAGLGTISVLAATVAITSNGVVFPGTLAMSGGTGTKTLTGTLTVGTLDIRNTTGVLTLTGGTINTNSLVSTTLTSGTITGTTKLVLTGTGTVSFPVAWAGSIANSIDIDSVSTTFVNSFRYLTGTLRYISGTVDASACTLVLMGSCTLNTAGMSWSNVACNTTLTLTLASNLNISGEFIVPVSTNTVTFAGAFVVNTGTLNFPGTTGARTLTGGTINTNSLVSTTLTSGTITGTTKLVLTGTGTVSFPVAWTGSIAIDLDIDSVSTTFVNNFRHTTKTLRYVAGTVDTLDSTLVLIGSCTLNTAGLEWNNITVAAALTLTLTSAFTCSGTFTISGALTVVGTGFWTRVGNLTVTSSGLTLTLLNNLTVTGTFRNSSTFTINGNNLFVSSLKAGGYIFGTTTIVFNGTGTWSGAWSVANNVIINTAGTLTIGIGPTETIVPSTSEVNYAAYSTGTLTYTAGTVNLGDPSTGYLFITGSSTLNTSGTTWDRIDIITATTTLTSNLNVTNITFIGTNSIVGANRFTQVSTFTVSGTTSLTLPNNITVLNNFICTGAGTKTINGFQLICNGGITTTGTGNTAGTTTILLNGTGTWTAPTASDTAAIRNNTVINTTGTITFAGYPHFNTGTLTYTAGTVVTTGSELRCWANTTLNTAGISWDVVSFVGTITLTSNLTVTGRAKIGGTTTFVGVSRFTQVPVLEIVDAATFTLINNITVTDTFKSSNNGSAQNLNNFQVICNGGITTTGTGTIAGTTTILLNGTGTWTSDSSDITVTSNAIRNNVTINTAGIITFVDKASFNTGTLTYVAGTLVTNDGILACNASTTLNTPGINWHSVLLSGTITLSAVLNVTNTTILSSFVTFIGVNRFTQTGNLKLVNGVDLRMINDITVLENIITLPGDTTEHYLGVLDAGTFEIYTSGFDIQGDTTNTFIQSLFFDKIIVNGTGTWQGKVWLFGDLIINTAGTLTVVGDVYARNGSITYQEGTVVTTGSTLNCIYGLTLDTDGILWNNVTISKDTSGGECTLNSTLNITGTLDLYISGTSGTSLELKGTAGFIANNVNIVQDGNMNPYGSTLPNNLKLQSNVDYEILSTFIATDNANRHRLLINSSTPEQKAILTLAPGASQKLAYVDATDIDSSLGQKIWSYDAVLTRTDNWQDLNASAIGTGTGTTSAETAYTWVC